MEKLSSLRSEKHIQAIQSEGILIGREVKNFGETDGLDLMYPYIVISMCVSGSAHALYDMREIHIGKNDIFLGLPGHMIRPLSYSDDFVQMWLLFDPAKYTDSELTFNKKDLELIHHAPICHLTDEQAQVLLSSLNVIEFILSRTEDLLPNRHRMLEAQLSLTYELYISIRRESDQLWEKDRMGQIYLQFCNLVTTHYKEERNVNYYANILGYDSRYFAKIFKAYNNGVSPLEWIQQYITTHAKRLMTDQPKISVKQIAFQLGFPTSANFCRYFKRATGMTPQEFKDAN